MHMAKRFAKVETIYDVRERAKSDLSSLGLRDRHKIDKLDRISAAALLLFSRDGYEKARLRDIAAEAGVALGTLGLYARDKRDLILLLFNRLIPPLIDKGREASKDGETLNESLVAYFTPFYATYAEDVSLYRMVLDQIFSPVSAHAQENREIRTAVIGDLADCLRRAIESGECDRGTDMTVQPLSFFYLYFAAVRTWLSGDQPDPAQGISHLRVMFEQHVQGLRPR